MDAPARGSISRDLLSLSRGEARSFHFEINNSALRVGGSKGWALRLGSVGSIPCKGEIDSRTSGGP